MLGESVLVAVLCVHAIQQTPPAAKHDTGLQTLPARALHDSARLASRGPLISLAIGGAMAALAHPDDSRIVHAFKAEHTPEEALDGGSIIGDGWIQGGAAAGVYAIGRLTHRDGAAELGSELLEAQAINGVLTQGLKYAVNRMRPNGGRYSFPSGHASATFATADIFEQRFCWKIGVLAYAGATYVLLSRLGEHAHYPSDTIFGAALGIAAARSVMAEHRRIAFKGFVVVPVVSKDRAMILLTRTQ